MACVESDGPPPKELKIAWACERWHTMPDVGAYFDQDFGLMQRMTGLSNVYNALTRMKNLPGKQIHSLTDGERKILGALARLGLIFNG